VGILLYYSLQTIRQETHTTCNVSLETKGFVILIKCKFSRLWWTLGKCRWFCTQTRMSKDCRWETGDSQLVLTPVVKHKRR